MGHTGNAAMKKLKTIIFYFLAALFFVPATANADETIKDFRSEITVKNDWSMTVTETMSVSAEQEKTKRGIYRQQRDHRCSRRPCPYTPALYGRLNPSVVAHKRLVLFRFFLRERGNVQPG